MNQDNRYEIKFILNEMEYTEALRWVHINTRARTSYPRRRIHSLYFDDTNFESVRDNLSGTSDRKKTRLRWYGDQLNTSSPEALFLEYKIRKGRLGCKQRVELSAFKEFFIRTTLSDYSQYINKELMQLGGMKLADSVLSPSIYVNYMRDYYADNSNIKFTFDSDIVFHDINPCVQLTNLTPVWYPKRILEIKFSPEQKENVSQILSTLRLTPKRHSKYLTGLSHLGQVMYL